MGEDQFLAFLVAALTDVNLEKCSAKSKFIAAQKCATLRLVPQLDHVALIPRWNKKTGCTEVNVMPQWQGYKAIMERCPHVREVRPVLIHVRDRYQFIDGVLTHDYDPFDTERTIKTIKDIRGGYLKVFYTDGRPVYYHTVTADYISKCRTCADTTAVWDKWFEQQALKTVVRSAFARRVVPLDPLYEGILQDAVRIDDLAMRNDPTRVSVEAPQASNTLASLTDQMTHALPPENPMLDEPATVDAAPPKEDKPARKRRTKKAPDPVEEPPKAPIDVFAAKLGKCKSADECNDLWVQMVEFGKELDESEQKTALSWLNSRLDVLSGKAETATASEGSKDMFQ